MTELNELLEHLIEQRGSDLHIKAGSVPHIRVSGRLQRTTYGPMTPADLEAIVAELLPVARTQELAERGETSVAYGVSGLGRFRANVYRQRSSYGLSIRWIVPGAPSIGALNLPSGVEELTAEESGLVLIVGPASSGKTTTAAAMLDHINATRAVHIVTVEDPIEVLLSDKSSMVSQREVGVDARTFADALRRINHLDPDVLFVSDLPDADTISDVLRVASAGRLVVATLAAASASEAIERLITYFPVGQQAQIRYAISVTVRGVISQCLVAQTSGHGLVPNAEVMTSGSPGFDDLVSPSGT